MGIIDVVLIGLGLSMDAAAISMTNSMVYKSDKKLKLMPFFFGGFQLFMTLLGCFTGGIFEHFVKKYAGIIAFAILLVIGINMIKESRCKGDNCPVAKLTIYILTAQAVATAIDAFATGISFGFMGNTLSLSIYISSIIIGIITFICTILAMILGKKFGEKLEAKAEMFGGIILILIGTKSLIGF